MITKHLYHTLIFILVQVLIISCSTHKRNERQVSVSILPQKYFVERIAGDYLTVNVMVPPGMNPATCDLSTDQLKELYDSKLCFTIGYLPFEVTHLYPILKGHGEIQVINHSDGLELASGGCGHTHEGTHAHGVDPHIWLSPRYAHTMASTILNVLSKQYPEMKEQFEHNFQQLSAEIDSVSARASRVMAQNPHRSFLIYHPALTYFALDYGLEQVSIEDEGKEPNPAHLKQIIDTAKEKNIHWVFIQNQFDVNNAQSIAREIGATVISIDPLSENWTKEMNHLLDVFENRTDRN